MANEKIRKELQKDAITYHMLGLYMNPRISETTVYRLLRDELSPDKAVAIRAAIEKCKAARKEDSAA